MKEGEGEAVALTVHITHWSASPSLAALLPAALPRSLDPCPPRWEIQMELWALFWPSLGHYNIWKELGSEPVDRSFLLSLSVSMLLCLSSRKHKHDFFFFKEPRHRIALAVRKKKCSGIGERLWLYDLGSVLSATEAYTRK